MSGVSPSVTVAVVAYFLPRGMNRAQYTALGLGVALRDPRTLRPDPKAVKQAVLTAKTLGFDVVRVDATSMDLRTRPGPLATHFGAAIVPGDEGPPATGDALADAANPSQTYAAMEPLDTSPLRDLVYVITPVARAEPMMPPPPGEPNPRGVRGKIEPWHLWPDELRQALNGVEADGGTPPQDRHRHLRGSGAEIAIVDSGVDRTHPWIITDLGIAPGHSQRIVQAVQPQLMGLRDEFTREGARSRYLEQYLDAILPFVRPRRIAATGRYWLDPPSGTLIHGTTVAGISIGRLDPLDADTDPYALKFYEYLQSMHRGTDLDLIQEFVNDVARVGGDAASVVDISGNVRPLLEELRGFLQFLRQPFDSFVRWASGILDGSNIDVDGHGTMMAVSMLSVAPAANVRSFAAHWSPGPQLHHPYVQRAATWLYRDAFAEAVHEVRTAPTAGQRIISNSWGDELLPMQPGTPDQVKACQASIGYWRLQIAEAVRHNIVVCFAAGNANKPTAGTVSVQALTGPAGAIIVGGAYKKPGSAAFSIGDGDVYLSSAAHAYDYEAGGIFPGAGRIPSVCALVGPQLANGTSPYVYLPHLNRTWTYVGGGTSSACAQVAGICALIRALHPGFSALEIKALIEDNGQAVEQGESFNRRGSRRNVVDPSPSASGAAIQATDLTPRLKLVSIRDVVKVADAKARKRHFASAAGRP
jgi:hypothetical protein